MRQSVSKQDKLLITFTIGLTIVNAIAFIINVAASVILLDLVGAVAFICVSWKNRIKKRQELKISSIVLSLIWALSFTYIFYLINERFPTIKIFLYILEYLLAFTFGIFLFSGIRVFSNRIDNRINSLFCLKFSPNKTALIVFIYTVLSISLMWIRYFPYGESSDLIEQLAQIHGEKAFSDIHAIGHTIFLKLLLNIWDNCAIVVIVQILMIAFMFALFSRFFTQKGVPFSIQFFIYGIFNLSSYYIINYVAPLKDIPYVFCIGILVYLVIRYIDSPVSFRIIDAVFLGMSMAGIVLFRLNGIIIVIVLGAYFIVQFIRNKQFFSFLTTVACILAICSVVNWYAYDVLKTVSPPNGFGLQAVGTGIASATLDDNLSDEEYNEISKMFPIDFLRKEYKPWNLTGLIWGYDGNEEIAKNKDLQVLANGFIYSMGKNKLETIKLYFKLMPNHMVSYLKNIAYGTLAAWGLRKPSDIMWFSNINLLLLLIVAVLSKWRKKEIQKHWIVFMPIICNVFSIIISTVTNERRYFIPTYLMFPFLIIYVFYVSNKRENG